MEKQHEEEIWRPIPYENFNHYLISNLGNCKNSKTNYTLTPTLVSKYHMYSLAHKGKTKKFMVSRLVADVFLEKNDKNDDIVYHKDGNKLNNIASNLEWSTNSKRIQSTGIKNKTNKRVIRIAKDGNHTLYDSITNAAKANNVARESVRDALRGKSKTSAGYTWKYEDESHNPIIVDLSNYKKINGYDNYYISENGNIYNINNKQFLKFNYMDGYPKIMLFKNAKFKNEYVHRLVAIHYVPNPENKPIVNHINGNIKYPHYYNLEWVSKKENMVHSNYLKNKALVLTELLKNTPGFGERPKVQEKPRV